MIYFYYSSCIWLLLISATGFIIGGAWQWSALIFTCLIAIAGVYLVSKPSDLWQNLSGDD